jgi:hypothetical protein
MAHKPKYQSEEGFALAGAIFAILVVAILVTAGFLFSSQEYRIGQSSDRTVQARMLAEDGLNAVMALQINQAEVDAIADLEPWDSQVFIQRDSIGDGGWVVDVTRVGDRLYRMESTGRITQGGNLAGAERRLAVMARNTANPPVDFNQIPDDAALRTQGDVAVRGNAQILGYDEPVPNWGSFGSSTCPGTPQDVAGVITSGSANTQSGASRLEGVPDKVEGMPVQEPEDFMTFGEGDEQYNWDDMVAAATHSLPGGTFPGVGPDYVSGVCNTANPMNWGEPHQDPANALDGDYLEYPLTHCWHYFPVIHIDGNAQVGGGGSAGGRGQGILLVDGNLNINGGFEFYGMILVRGQVETQGNGNRVIGSIRATGATDLEASDYAGGSILRYSSCAVSRAQNNAFQPAGQLEFVPVGSRSWMDLTAAGF